MSNLPHTRRFPMARKAGFVPAVQRYSATRPDAVASVDVLYLGLQMPAVDDRARSDFLIKVSELFAAGDGPVHHDYAHFVDPAGFPTVLAVAYWMDPDACERWGSSEAVTRWWEDEARVNGPGGLFRERFRSSIDRTETIAFKEYVRGLSACPMSRLEPMGESGYWGAARDRIPASAHDRFLPQSDAPVQRDDSRQTLGRRVRIVPSPQTVLIRSGVTWKDCGQEQLTSYRENLQPVLDAGMEHLRTDPEGTGCYCLRQVDVLSADGSATSEAWSAGYFRSLADLEHWAWNHPTHLAIFGRAQKERIKYQERLELRTYHEVYVIDDGAEFDYVNCHPGTGLLPYRLASR